MESDREMVHRVQLEIIKYLAPDKKISSSESAVTCPQEADYQRFRLIKDGHLRQERGKET